MAVLERSIIKDNTLLPGEWYDGQLHLQAPSSDDGPMKIYTITVLVGADPHEISVVQGSPSAYAAERDASPPKPLD